MPKTCLTCLTHDKLFDLGEREWKVLEYLIYPSKKYLSYLKTHADSGICSKCQGSMICIDKFRTSAMGNFTKLMELWEMENQALQKDTILIKVEPDLCAKQEEISTDDNKDAERDYIKEEPIVEGSGTDTETKDSVPDVKVEDSDDDGSSKDDTTKIMLANVLQNMYVVQPPTTPPCTLKVVDLGKLQGPQTTEQISRETTAEEAETCKSKDNLKQITQKRAKKTKNSTAAHDSAPVKFCEMCNIHFHNIYKYNTHMKSHNSMVHCEPCDRWYSANTYKIHMRTSQKHNKIEDFKSLTPQPVSKRPQTRQTRGGSTARNARLSFRGKGRGRISCDRILEPLAVALKSFCGTTDNQNVRISEDNLTQNIRRIDEERPTSSVGFNRWGRLVKIPAAEHSKYLEATIQNQTPVQKAKIFTKSNIANIAYKILEVELNRRTDSTATNTEEHRPGEDTGTNMDADEHCETTASFIEANKSIATMIKDKGSIEATANMLTETTAAEIEDYISTAPKSESLISTQSNTAKFETNPTQSNAVKVEPSNPTQFTGVKHECAPLTVVNVANLYKPRIITKKPAKRPRQKITRSVNYGSEDEFDDSPQFYKKFYTRQIL